MKYRIKKETYIDSNGALIIWYYPQHKHWWCPWWYNYGTFDTYSDYVSFSILEDAEKYLKWVKSKKYKVEYLYHY